MTQTTADATERTPVARRPVTSALTEETWSAETLIERIGAGEWSVGPFDDTVVAFCAQLSSELLAMRDDPAAVSLGFWLRPASIAKLGSTFGESLPARVVAVPRGLAFHVTPANVDTIFAYSWVLSMLAGNANIVRLSSRTTPARDRLLGVIAEVLARESFEGLRRRNALVLSEHDDTVSRDLSAACDVRIIWGGDDTVERFRRFPLRPRARDILFPSRHSVAILDVAAVAELDDEELRRLSDGFFNDAYWFDQGACSSPRLVIWSAEPHDADRVGAVRARFHDAVIESVKARGYVTETGAALNKLAMAMERAAATDGLVIDRTSNEATWVRIPSLDTYERENCGGGLFFEYVSFDLARDLGGLVHSQDQTAACFGISDEQARALARGLAGRGIDRFVPVGRALEFESEWDGMDLMQELTKRVVVDPS